MKKNVSHIIQSITIIYLLMSFMSCTEHVIGKIYCNSGNDIFYKLNLNDKNLYDLYWNRGLSSDTLKGRWERKKNKIYLYPHIDSSTYFTKNNIVENSLCMNIYIKKYKETIPYVDVILRDETNKTNDKLLKSDINGSLCLSEDEINNYNKIIIQNFHLLESLKGIEIPIVRHRNIDIFLAKNNGLKFQKISIKKHYLKYHDNIRLSMN